MSTRIRTALVSLLAIALLAWFLRSANLAAVGMQIRHARIDLLVVALIFVAVTYVVRTIRWQYLLQPIGPTRFSNAFRTTVIGFAAMGLLPARAGDVLRPYLLARREGLSATSTFATIVMERVLDLVAVLSLLALYVWVLGGRDILPPQLLRPIELSTAAGAAASVVMMAAMWTLATHPERVARFVLRSERVLPHRVAHALSELARTFSHGFAVAREPRALVLALLWSFPVWLAIAMDAWVVSEAFGIHMPFAGSFLVQALLVIGVAVPTPGAVGSFHEAYRIAVTTFFHAPNDAAIGAAIVLHAASFIPVVTLGIIFMIRDGLSITGLQRLAGVARREERAEGNEVPVLRPSGR
jgi:glycosyltransferase 2 family protein